jgi:hypothetical protein
MVGKTMVPPKTNQNPWLMVKPWSTKKPVYEPGSSPSIGIFILYFFNVSCQAEPQNHSNVKISVKY